MKYVKTEDKTRAHEVLPSLCGHPFISKTFIVCLKNLIDRSHTVCDPFEKVLVDIFLIKLIKDLVAIIREKL